MRTRFMHGIAFAAIAVAVPNASFANDAVDENTDKTDDRSTIVVEGLPIEDYSASDRFGQQNGADDLGHADQTRRLSSSDSSSRCMIDMPLLLGVG